MSTPPQPGSVIRYSYLWSHEVEATSVEDGRKDRPCALVAAVRLKDGRDLVYVLPITSRRPVDAAEGIEIPSIPRRRLGLQDAPCWIVVTELNRFVWPGPDLRPVERPFGLFCCFGALPAVLFRSVQAALDARRKSGLLVAITRTPS